MWNCWNSYPWPEHLSTTIFSLLGALIQKTKKDSNSHLARKSVRCSVTDRKIHLSGKRNNSFVVVVDGEGMANYNEQFVEAWKQTTNYQVWRGKEHAGIDDVHAG